MSRGPGTIERRIGELFAATRDRALSVGELAATAFELNGAVPDRKQRLSATRAAHRLLRRAAAATQAMEAAFERVVAETTAMLGRPPGGRGRESVHFVIGPRTAAVDKKFAEAMRGAPSWHAYERAWPAMRREEKRFGCVLVDLQHGGWRAAETENRRLWFHPVDYPVRVWAVALEPEGVVWADTELVGIDNTYIRVRYRGEPARLDRRKLARSWTLYRNVLFTSARSGYAARSFDQMWQERYRRPGSASPPPAPQMPFADAIRLLGVPADFTRDDVMAAFRRKAFKCHPDYGGTAEQFQLLMDARDRLLAALGTRAKGPEFAPKGVKLRYGVWRPHARIGQIGQSRRLAR